MGIKVATNSASNRPGTTGTTVSSTGTNGNIDTQYRFTVPSAGTHFQSLKWLPAVLQLSTVTQYLV